MRPLAAVLVVALAAPVHAGPIGRAWRAGRALFPRRAAPVHAELDEALRDKALWQRRDLLFRAGLTRAQIDERLGAVEASLRGRGVYPVDAGGHARALQSPSLVEQHVRALDRELADALPAAEHARVREVVARALAQVRGRSLFARPGLAGLADLLEDELIGQPLAPGAGHAIAAVRDAAERTSLTPIDAARPALEVRYALKKDPGLRARIAAARADGVEISFRRAERTPAAALEAINRIAVATQENYLLNWLPGLVLHDRTPRLAVSAVGRDRAVAGGLFAEGATDEQIGDQLARDVRTIRQAARRMMGFVLDGPGRHAGLDAALEAAVDDLRADHALARMLFDNADERTGKAQEIIKKMMWVGPVAHGIEMLDHTGVGVAKLFAGTADDLMGFYGEREALRESGFTPAEIRKRYGTALAVFAGASYASYRVEHLLRSGHTLEAGALFGVSAVALSLTTALQSMAMYRRGYDALVREGKIDGKVGPLAGDARFQAMLRTFDRSASLLAPARKADLLALARRHLDGLGEAISAEDKAGILDALAHLDLEQIDAQVRSPSQLRRWKEAVRQDFSNPTRLGILLGSAMAPFTGLVAAKAGLMDNGFVMAAIGSTESLVGGLLVSAAKRLDDRKQRRALEAKLAALGAP